MLRANLDDEVSRQSGIARRLHFLENVAHGLFTVAIFAGIRGHLQHRGMRVLRRGNHDRVYIFERQQFLRMLERTRRLAIVLLVCGNGAFQIVAPQVADRRHLYVFLIFETRHDAVKLAATIADTNMPQRDSIVGSGNACVGQRRAAQRCASRDDYSALLQKISPVDLTF